MSANPQAANTATISEMRALQAAPPASQHLSDQTVDMFSERGFQLAQRIGKAFATSDAVPAQFRLQIEKKGRSGSTWIENPSAIGNCLVAIETARAVGMSITAVMQQANVIEGRLTWSGKFIIAAINASGRFTPLRFQIRNLGVIKAKYREKQGWNDQKRGYDFKEVEVEVENLECIAWAYIVERGRTTTERVESAPVSMKMAVEEGWYGKSGSKWQTEMKHLMLQYRAGSFFGNIHAPDIVMGMGRTSEEMVDTTVIDVAPDGTVTNVSIDEARRPAPAAANTGAVTDVVQKNSVESSDEPNPETGEVPARAQPTAAATAATDAETKGFDVGAFADKLDACKTSDDLDALFDTLRATSATDDEKAVLLDVYNRKANDIDNLKAAATPAPATSRRARSAAPSVE